MPVRLVVFDLDGTLVDTFGDIAGATNFALAQSGRETLSLSEIRNHVGRGLRNLIKGVLGEETDDQFMEQTMENVIRYYSEHPTDHSIVYPGVFEALSALEKAEIDRGLLSNKMDLLVQKVIGNLNLAERFTFARGKADDTPLKPDVGALLPLLHSLEVAPEECLVVGDSLPDYELAKNIGADFCAVSYGIEPREVWEDLDSGWVVDDVREILEQII